MVLFHAERNLCGITALPALKGEPHLLSAPDSAPRKESSQGAEASRPKSSTEALCHCAALSLRIPPGSSTSCSNTSSRCWIPTDLLLATGGHGFSLHAPRPEGPSLNSSSEQHGDWQLAQLSKYQRAITGRSRLRPRPPHL